MRARRFGTVLCAALLLVAVAGCSSSSPTGVKANFVSTINGQWASNFALASGSSCMVTVQLNLTASATGELTGTAAMNVCNGWNSGTVAITSGSTVNPTTGALVINAASPLGSNFFVGAVQATVTTAGTTDIGLVGTITGDGLDWTPETATRPGT